MDPTDQTSFTCVVNGEHVVLAGDDTTPAITALRAHGLFSVRETCGIGVCGTCTVLLDGEPVSACILPLYALGGRTVQTAEGLEGQNGELSDLQRQFIASQAFQCSFCTPGFLMSGQALLDSTDGPLDDEAIEEGLQGHLCRCGCYAAITEAVRECAAARMCGRAAARH
ncbi:(2Fe-2S)-binding protein [Pseudonocardia acidicola]|uniref:2Fe-2S iron-sulfur cluster binding domain-containing protein n=1 Tax=Pseudonocardia acidicola TaxID=2724939 RepID=A0ABX1S996_9PSEU|nr:2Fe-2S iron-sulfur cluster-binding protein [Pseudonocardia acidicola]NMH96829.1 2Fe-2S iron-sulfur cluster binding domain-containing protein [Pseudonocardia acidicola]